MGRARVRPRETKKHTGQPQLRTPWTGQKPRRMQLKERQRQAHRCDRDKALRREESEPVDSPSEHAGETQEIDSTQLS